MAELNTAFSRWIAATYHLRVHSSTGAPTMHAEPVSRSTKAPALEDLLRA